MSDLSRLFLVRHGQTPWTISRQHTGRTDVPLTPRGERDAIELAHKLNNVEFERVLTSPLQRARRTCELAGFIGRFEPAPDLMEWDYGCYDGVTTADIRKQRPDWNVFLHGAPGGESPDDIGRRADRLLERLRPLDGETLLFSHGHFLRVLAARWLGLPVADGRLFALGTTTVSILGYEHDRSDPVLLQWNA
ncbi:MAG: histidine phosphatase family protein [Tepidisphaeraceae bacterium]